MTPLPAGALLPWERLLWSGRSLSFPRTRYLLTDFRLARFTGGAAPVAEIAITDIADVRRSTSRIERLLGVSTLVVHPRDTRRSVVVLRRIRRGEQLAALLELLAADPHRVPDTEIVRAALSSTPWQMRSARERYRNAIVGIGAVSLALFGIVIGLNGHTASVAYPPDDAIRPGGVRRSQADIVRFMESTVLPWAQDALGPLVGGGERVTCATCHGPAAAARAWQMPGVAALPMPDVRIHGWERYNSTMDAQIRNAIYGYGAGFANQDRAAYMREVVMPGMARLLHRPAYDFTKTYEYNRTHAAFGCYHCHRVE